MMARFSWYADPPSPRQLKKNSVRVRPPLTKLSGSAHDKTGYVSCGCYPTSL